MEAQLVPKYGIPIRFIQISGLRGKGIKALLNAPLPFFVPCCRQKLFKKKSLTLYLVWEAMFLAPLALRQKLCGVPIILHEQNAIAGLTNKLLGKIATCVLQAFPTAFPHAGSSRETQFEKIYLRCQTWIFVFGS